MDYESAYEFGIKELEKAGIDEAKLDARLLLERVCDTDHSALIAHPERELTQKELDEFNEFIERRSKREPVAYMLGQW